MYFTPISLFSVVQNESLQISRSDIIIIEFFFRTVSIVVIYHSLTWVFKITSRCIFTWLQRQGLLISSKTAVCWSLILFETVFKMRN